MNPVTHTLMDFIWGDWFSGEQGRPSIRGSAVPIPQPQMTGMPHGKENYSGVPLLAFNIILTQIKLNH